MDLRKALKKTWHFLWHDDSPQAWVVSILVAFVVIRYVLYPGLGLLLGTGLPAVAVVSGSMQHFASPLEVCEGQTCENIQVMCGIAVEKTYYSFDEWWDVCGKWYEDNQYNTITQDEFREFPLRNGFAKGDIIVLRGKDVIEVGDILVYDAQQAYPIIHRVVDVRDGEFFTTKGDNNKDIIRRATYEENISQDQVIGVAWFKIPLVGYVKILFTDFIVEPIVNLFK